MKEEYIHAKNKFFEVDYSIYILTDENISEQKLFYILESCMLDFATVVQLRIKKKISKSQFLKLALDIKKITDKYEKPLIINDNVEIAKLIDCSGVHIGQDDTDLIEARKILGPNKIIGVSVFTVEEAKIAEVNGANYLGVGAIFKTTTKKDAKMVSINTLKEIKKSVKIPVVAIGGITEDNITCLYGLELDGVAFISEIMKSDNINKKIESLRNKIKFL